MFASRTPGHRRLNKAHKVSLAGIAAVGAASVAFTLVPSNATAGAKAPSTTGAPASLAGTANSAHTGALHAKAVQPAPAGKAAAAHTAAVHAATAKAVAKAKAAAKAKAVASARAHAHAVNKAHAEATARAKATSAAHARAHAKAVAHAKAAAHAKAKARAEARAHAKAAAARHAHRHPAHHPVYGNNLNGWIRESLAVMKAHHIPGSYSGLHRNIIRESSGNPNAINLWDINAQNGVPSKGLLQVIQPTFNTYHVAGTSENIYQPVSNIVAAANYAAHRYGSIDNVNSAY